MSEYKIPVSMVSAIKVQFKKIIFEDDFVEKGMTAWLTDVEWDARSECYQLWFDFTEFEDINLKYFKQVYHPNKYTKDIEARTGRMLFTAIEAGQYNPKYSTGFSVGDMTTRDDFAFQEKIQEFLKVVED